MDTDLILTLGIVLGVLTVPSLLSAWVEGRFPRVGALLALAALAMVLFAMLTRPTGYTFAEIPTVMLNVAGRFIN